MRARIRDCRHEHGEDDAAQQRQAEPGKHLLQRRQDVDQHPRGIFRDPAEDRRGRRQYEDRHREDLNDQLPQDHHPDEKQERQHPIDQFRHGVPSYQSVMYLFVQSLSSGTSSFWPPNSICSFCVDAHFSLVIMPRPALRAASVIHRVDRENELLHHHGRRRFGVFRRRRDRLVGMRERIGEAPRRDAFTKAATAFGFLAAKALLTMIPFA